MDKNISCHENNSIHVFLAVPIVFLLLFPSLYGVSTKKVLHKSEEKMNKKMKMTSQRAENLVHV